VPGSRSGEFVLVRCDEYRTVYRTNWSARKAFHSVTLALRNHVRIDAQRGFHVSMAQLILERCQRYRVLDEFGCEAMTKGIETGMRRWNAEPLENPRERRPARPELQDQWQKTTSGWG
jgi:hypothetical protein